MRFTFIRHYWNLHYIQGITCNISGFWIWQSGVLYYYQFRDSQHITFVTFIRFGLLLSKKNWPTLFFTNNIKLDKITKTECKIRACFEFCLKFWSYFLWKLWDKATISFVFCCFTSALTSGDITFYKFLGLHSTLIKKIFLSQIFLC